MSHSSQLPPETLLGWVGAIVQVRMRSVDTITLHLWISQHCIGEVKGLLTGVSQKFSSKLTISRTYFTWICWIMVKMLKQIALNALCEYRIYIHKYNLIKFQTDIDTNKNTSSGNRNIVHISICKFICIKYTCMFIAWLIKSSYVKIDRHISLPQKSLSLQY